MAIRAVLLFVAFVLTQTTTPSAEQSAIVGTVIDATSRTPLVGATVTITPRSSPAPAAAVRRTSDASGRFECLSLAPGKYDIRANKTGYFPGIYGVDAPWEPGGLGYLQLRQNERRQVTIPAWKYSSISGAVYDDRHEPALDASIQLLKRTPLGWVRASAAVKPDERGEFQVRPLAPGDYLAVLLAPTQAASALGGTFYPDASDAAGATVIQLQPAEDRTGVIFVRDRQRMRAGVRVSGRIAGAPDGLPVYLTPSAARDALGELQRLTAHTAPDGRFSFSSVPAGDFRIEAWRFPEVSQDVLTTETSASGSGVALRGLPKGGGALPLLPALPTLVADTEVRVMNTDVGNLTLELHPGAHIRGRVVLDGSSRPDSSTLPTLPVIIRPATAHELGSIPQARVETDGTFQSIGLPAGKYVIGVMPTVTSPGFADWEVLSVRDGANELVGEAVTLGDTDLDLAITLSNRLPEIVGTVVDASGKPVPAARVVALPTDRSRWDTFLPYPAVMWTTQTTADEYGAFSMRVLPGQYFVGAVERMTDFWRSTEFLSTLVSPNPVTLALGDKKSVTIRSTLKR